MQKAPLSANATNRLEDTMNRYDDIINLPYPFESRHPRMPLEKRAAQFAPFSALSGHGEAIEETARRVEVEN